jgi:hypothetical protein
MSTVTQAETTPLFVCVELAVQHGAEFVKLFSSLSSPRLRTTSPALILQLQVSGAYGRNEAARQLPGSAG